VGTSTGTPTGFAEALNVRREVAMNFFDNGLGITADSLAFFREHRHQLGSVVAAEVSFPGLSDHYPYCFELRDDRGNRMFLSGLTAGYSGEGPRGAMEALVEVGFPITDAQRVMHDRQVILRQGSWPPDPELPPMHCRNGDVSPRCPVRGR
jgi:hypothetical protein